MRNGPAVPYVRNLDTDATMALAIRILENARREALPMRTEWVMSKDCRDILDLLGLSRDWYRMLMKIPDTDYVNERITGKL